MNNPFLNQKVLIRDHMAGVLIGVLISQEGKQWILQDARKIHYWEKAAAVEGIVATGSVGTKSRITPSVGLMQGFDAVQIIILPDDAYNQLQTFPDWTP